MAKAKEIAHYLDDFLRIKEFKDFTSNGLQVEGTPEVSRIGFAVDACLQSFEELSDCQMIVVHHGLWWPSIERLVGMERKRLQALLSRDINLYVCHLPLDKHPQVGNNAQILQKLGLSISGAFGEVGWYADLEKPEPLEEWLGRGRELLDPKAQAFTFGPAEVRRIAVCSGSGGGKELQQAADIHADLYITGEGGHSHYHLARELGLNVLYGGHYRSEVWGVQALMPYLEEAFGVETRFGDCPTGL